MKISLLGELLLGLEGTYIHTSFLFVCRPPSVNDKIFALIRELAGDQKTVKVSDIIERCSTKGYNRQQVDSCIEEYEELNVWQVNQTHTKLTFI